MGVREFEQTTRGPDTVCNIKMTPLKYRKTLVSISNVVSILVLMDRALGHSHSPVELFDLKDMENLVVILVASLKALEAGFELNRS